MRSPTDLPRRRANRGRIWLVVAAAAVFILLTSLRGIASFYTTYLWFRELHLTSVWRGVLGTKVVLAVGFTLVFFVLLYVDLLIVDRTTTHVLVPGPEDELVQRYRATVGRHAAWVRLVVAGLFALLAGTGTASEWNAWLMFRHSVSFGIKDPQFHRDVSWFMFKMPFLSFLVSWAFVAVMIIFVVTLVAYYLNGSIRLQSPAQRFTSQVKAHVSVLLAAMALVKAAGYWLQRFDLDLSTRGYRNGAGYTDVKAQLPAIKLLFFISLVAAALFIYNIWRRGWVLPIIGVGLWLFISVIVGAIYPAFIQKFKVDPAENARERPYITRNITATRHALGIDNVETQPFDYNTNLTQADLANDADTIRNVRLWDPGLPDIKKTYQKLQEIRAYYVFNDIDVDRYTVNGQMTQTISAAREINPSDLPSQSWVNRRLQYTHGYGAILSPANAVTEDGKPNFVLRDVPPAGTPALKEPRVYYGENTGGYVIANTGQNELDYQDPNGGTKSSNYGGTGGVKLGSIFRRLAFVLRFGDINPLISNEVHSNSKALYIRDIGERVRTAAPFLRYDSDPYSVIIDGKLYWIQDAYTTSTRYPYAQQADTDRLPTGSDLGAGGFNYVRNSVKVVIDAYNGSMQFFLVDPKDPVARVYQKAFPNLFTSVSDMSDEMRAHLRYPEDLFRMQTNMYGRYHITNPNDFYNAADAWNISQDPGSGDPAATLQTTQSTNAQGLLVGPARSKRMDPAYLIMRLPNDKAASFLILQPFVPASQGGDKQQNLSSFMTAKSDPGEYGKLQVFVMPRDTLVEGPALINARISADSTISKEISLLNTNGSQVRLGNILVIPIKQSLLYIRPLYVQSSQNPVPELRRVIVVYAGHAQMSDSLQGALTAIFGNAPPTQEQQGSANGGGTTPTPSGPVVAPNVQALLDQAQTAYDAAQAALKAGDLAEYQRQMNKVGDFIGQARAAQASSPSGGGPTTTTTAPGSSA